MVIDPCRKSGGSVGGRKAGRFRGGRELAASRVDPTRVRDAEAAAARSPVQLTPGTPAVEVVAEIGVEPSDLVVPRFHGLSPWEGTELDSLLRNLGIRTVIAAGVSVNVAVMNLAFDAVNAGYQVVIPRDCVAATPPEYADAVFAPTLGFIATLVESEDAIGAWRRA